MTRERSGGDAGDSPRERKVPPFLTTSPRESKRKRDNCRLLNPSDPPLRTAKLGEQAKRKNHTEDGAPADVEDLVACLVDVHGQPVDQDDQPEVDRQRSKRDTESRRLQQSRATYA